MISSSLLSLASVGLIFDAAGVIALGYAFFVRPNKVTLDENWAYVDANIPDLRHAMESRMDGMFGTALLLVGFVVQLLSVMDVQSKTVSVLLLAVLFLIIVLYVTIVRRHIVNRRLKEVFGT